MHIQLIKNIETEFAIFYKENNKRTSEFIEHFLRFLLNLCMHSHCPPQCLWNNLITRIYDLFTLP